MKALLTHWGTVLHGGPVGAADLEDLEGKLYFDREAGGDAYIRFAILLVLSVVIATGGVLGDSTATVIGAMIVAPLMTPIMATALAMVTGDEHHLVRSLLLVAVGVLTAVGLSWAFGVLTPGSIDLSSNGQVQARISPRAIDLIVALASGAAGAFALSRRSVADALPGVAIAISLVPPLCVVGICLSQGQVDSAAGAGLLFVTNLVAILVAGGGMLALMGYGAVARRGVKPEHRRKAALVTGVALVAILVPLLYTSMSLAQDTLLEATARSQTESWLAGTDYELVEVTASGQDLEITIDGSGPLPPTSTLAASLAQVRPGVIVAIRAVAAQHIQVTGSPAP